jgi:GT2 family glycosyltransferase
MTVSAVVISHEQPRDLERCVRSLAGEVDEIVAVANTPTSAARLPSYVTVLANQRPTGYAANANAAVRRTSGELVIVANADVVPRDGAVATLASFMSRRRSCGIAGPQLVYPDGRLQPSRRAFPTVSGTLVRRTPLRRVRPPLEHQRSHYGLDLQPTGPVQADWMLGAFLMLRRSMLDELDGFDDKYRLYCEDIDLCYRAAKAGWERWYVPDAVVEHSYKAMTDARFTTRQTLWHWAGMAHFARKHPERLRSL